MGNILAEGRKRYMQLSEFKADARKVIYENAPGIFFVSVVFLIITTVMNELQFRLPGTSTAAIMALERLSEGELPSLALFYTNLRYGGAVLTFILILIRPVIKAGFMSYCLKISREQEGDFKDILDGFHFFVKIILISILTSILIALWSLLFFFPGLAAYYRYRQAIYILLDDPEKGVLQCISESKRLMRGSKLDLFLLDLSFIGWHFMNMLVAVLLPAPFSLPILSIWIEPYQGLSRAAFYLHLVNKLVV